MGHIMRKESLEELTLTGRIQGSKGRGRPRLTYMESLSNWIKSQLPEQEMQNITVLGILRKTKDRVLWNTMITYVLKGYGT